MEATRAELIARTVITISRVYSEESGIPMDDITTNTRIPNDEIGFTTVMRMANAIPGGGNLVLTPPKESTIGELAEQCMQEVERKAAEIKDHRNKKKH